MIGYSLKSAVGANPFVGPRPFETGRKIFGRDREIDDLYYLLSAERIVLLHSPSGAGKSSLIQAGLIPRLTERFDVWGPTRVNLQPPADQPAAINRYVRSTVLGFEQQIPAERRRTEQQLAQMTLTEYIATRPRKRSAPQNIVLIFDQFEEILTADPLAVDAKHEFFRQLGELLLDTRVWALFALREDYLAALDPYAEQVSTHLKNRFRLDLLGRDAARDAITSTSVEGGRKFDPAAADKLACDLATMKVQQPDGTFIKQIGLYIEPLQLQVVCRGLWERMPEEKQTIDLADIERFGDVTDALSDYYASEVARIADIDVRIQRTLREWVGDRLITTDGIRSQVLRGAGKSEGLNNDLVASLVNTHLVRGEQRGGAVWYELAHDRLIEPVRGNNRNWFDAHLHKVQKVAAVWEAQGRPDGLLLLEEDLTEAMQWARQQESSLTTVERKFLEASTAKQQLIEQEQKQARKLRRLLWSLVLVALMAAATAAFAVVEYQKAKQQKQISDGIAYVANMNLARSVLDRHNNQRLYEVLGAYLPANEGAQQQDDLSHLRSFYWYYLFGQQKYKEFHIKGHTEAISAVAFSPDGKTLASASEDNTVKLWDVKTREEIATFNGHAAPVRSVAFSPDGKTVASASKDKIKLWDVASQQEIKTLDGHKKAVWMVAFSPDGKMLASAARDNTVRLWDVTSQKEIKTFTAYSGDVYSVAFSPDGKTLASGSEDNTVKLWDVASRKELGILTGHEDDVYSVAFSPDGKMLATAGEDKTVKLWDMASRKEIVTFIGHQKAVWSVAFSPDSKMLATASEDRTVMLWDVKTLEEISTLDWHKGPVSAVAFSRDGETLASASSDKMLMFWDVKSRKESKELIDHEECVRSIAFSPDGKTLASASDSKTVKIWDVASRQKIKTLEGHSDAVHSVAFSPDGKTLASASKDKTVKLWDVKTQEEIKSLEGHKEAVCSVAFSPDGKMLASAAGDNTIKLWDVAIGKEIVTFNGHKGAVYSVAFSPNGRTLASASEDKTVKLWDVTSRKELARLIGHGDVVQSVAFSPDGRTLASAGLDKLVKMWDVLSHKELATLREHEDIVWSVAFSPDGRTLASASDDETVKLWNVGSRKELGTLTGHRAAVFSVAFSPDGRTLASGGSETNAAIYNLKQNEELRTTVMPVNPTDSSKLRVSETHVKLWIGASDKDVEAFRPRE